MKDYTKLINDLTKEILKYNKIIKGGNNENNFNLNELKLKGSLIDYIKAQIKYIELTKEEEKRK